MVKKVELPIFHLGTYTSANGSPVTFTPELLRQMERNTNLVIRTSKFQPPVGYDHPAARDTNAHGFISGVRYDGGKLIATLEGTSEQLRNDAREFRRLTYSPEFHEDYSFVHDGKPVKVGPTVIGLAMLGAKRGAIKNTAMVPLSEVAFGEAVSEVETLILREDLRAMGYVGEYVVDGKFFGEVENDASRFFEERQEPQMTDAEIKAMMDEQAARLTATFQTQLTAVKADADQKIVAMSEGAEKTRKVKERVAVIADEKKLGKIQVAALEEAALNPSTENVLAFGEKLSPIVLPGGSREKNAENTDGEQGEEPAALLKLKPKHFSDISANEAVIYDGLKAFGEFKPGAFKGVEQNQDAQIERLRSHVRQRDLGDA